MIVNIHTSHPSAFISSTFIDLHEERKYVANALSDRGLNVNALDIKPASTDSSKNEILSGIRESDFTILIIGDRYGSILPRMTGSDSLSITWWEYNNARKFGKPVIAFFKNMMDHDSYSHDDINESTYKKKRTLFDRFKKIVSNRHNPAYFSDLLELSGKIESSIIPTYRSGVKALNLKNTQLATKISELESQIERLKSASSNRDIGLKTETSKPSFGIGGLRDLSKYK
jgi:hypothetical protein